MLRAALPARRRAFERAAAVAFAVLLASGAMAAPAAPAKAPDKAAAAPANPDRVLAKVDGQPITERDVALANEDVGQSFANLGEAQKQSAIVDLLVDLKLAAKAARDEKLDQTPAFARQLAFMRDKALMQAFLDKAAAGAVTDAAVERVYDETVKASPPVEEVRARHILVATKDEADAVEKRLKNGEDFAAVARAVSKDTGSAKDGGELGFFAEDQMVPEFAKAAFALNPGQISQPVKTQFGWHVIQTEEKRKKPLPTLTQVRGQIALYLQRRAQQDAMAKLRKTAKVERFDKAAPAPAAPAAPGAGTSARRPRRVG
jgi:peptidyl-prolyl cis-trans isomerase C